MRNTNQAEYHNRERLAFRVGWEAGLRNQPNDITQHDDAVLNHRWTEGFTQGKLLRNAWNAAKVAARGS